MHAHLLRRREQAHGRRRTPSCCNSPRPCSSSCSRRSSSGSASRARTSWPSRSRCWASRSSSSTSSRRGTSSATASHRPAGMAFACYYMSLEGASEDERMSAILMAHALTFLVERALHHHRAAGAVRPASACMLVLGVVQLGIPYVLLGRASGSLPAARLLAPGGRGAAFEPRVGLHIRRRGPGRVGARSGVIVVATITAWCVHGDLRERKSKA